jgi:type II secretory pathway component PulF
MPSFAYKAADASGRVSAGVIDGASEADVLTVLEQQSLTPVQVRPAKGRFATSAGESSAADGSRAVSRTRAGGRNAAGARGPTKIRLRLRELLDFSRQLKTMLASGVTILSTLDLLRQRAKGRYLRLLDRISADIQRGSTLSEALAAHPHTFDQFYVGTMQAGEIAGIQTETLGELIAYYERRAALRREVVGALTYPAIVVLALIGACALMLTCVVPQFAKVFASTGTQLPLPTRILMGTSAFVTAHGWWLLAGLAVLVAAAWMGSRSPRVRTFCGYALARLPLFGQVVHLSTVVQFTRMIGLLERAGLPMLETLRVVTEMLMPGPVRTLTANVRRKVMTGSSIADAIGKTRVLPDMVQQMIVVGEHSGRIDETLAMAAAHYEDEIRVKIRRLTTMLEPMLTLLVSGLVLGVALAVFLPMWGTNTLLLKH